MAGTLTFNVGLVRSLMTHAMAAPTRSPSYEDLFNPAYHKGGEVKKDANDWPDADNLDHSKIPVGLWLVKDQGAYLMSNGNPRQLRDGTERSVIAYANECNPETIPFDEWWDAARRILGGDDCVITLPIEMFEAATAGKNDSDTFKLKVTSRSVTLVAPSRRAK